MAELRQLSMMAARFPDFDLAGKEMFLDKVGWQLQAMCMHAFACVYI
jgi:hypothetical protein